MGMSPGGAAPGASLDDATRDACLHSLGDHYATGRISVDELDVRIQRALAAETEEELASVMAGLESVPADGPGDDAGARRDPPRTGLGRLRTQVVRLFGTLLGFLPRRGRTRVEHGPPRNGRWSALPCPRSRPRSRLVRPGGAPCRAGSG